MNTEIPKELAQKERDKLVLELGIKCGEMIKQKDKEIEEMQQQLDCFETDLDEARNEITRLKRVIEKAIEVIKIWHNADDVWEIYLNSAPEMKEIKQFNTNEIPYVPKEDRYR